MRVSTPATVLRVAVVGSGPAGFYAAAPLLAAGVRVDMFERLPTPWGLVRLGVAPDHPNIKAVSRVFEKVAREPGFRFFGNVEIGRDLSRDDLRHHYHAVVWSVGAQTDRPLGIPGEYLPGSMPATAFVAWYNGHPDYTDLEVDLRVERVVVVGNGNVALDCARMLGLTRAELEQTDTTDRAIEAISASPLREILVLGRRGPAQAAFTTPELRELGVMPGADVTADASALQLDPLSSAEAERDATKRRNVELLRAYADRVAAAGKRVIHLRFLVSPVALRGDSRVEEIELVRNRLEASADGSVRAIATGETERITCGLVLRSIGYRGTPLPGVPFDQRRGVVPNRQGRVVDADGGVVMGEYCAGWIKRGPSGVIGTNKKDASETVQLLLADAAGGGLRPPAADPGAIEELVARRQPDAVEYLGWEAIDAFEREQGSGRGRPRVKVCDWAELVALGARRQPAH